jgi:perosamine synthetase
MEDDFLHFALPCIEQEEIEAVVEVLKSGWITTGPKTKQFEADFAKQIGCKHAIAVNSCTAALHLALEAINIGEQDAVVTTPMTFAATAEVISYFKAQPVFVDIDPITMNIDIAKLEEGMAILKKRACLKNVKAIIPVHFAGYPAPMDEILQVAKNKNLQVIEDAAHAQCSLYKGKIIGNISDMTCFSFYATKNMTTGEGGMITTNNDEWAERMRIMSLHGISRDAWKRYQADGNWHYDIIAPGFKYNLTDIASALGIVQLKKSHTLLARREKIAQMYDQAFSSLPSIETPPMGLADGFQHAWHLYVIKLNLATLLVDRDRFMDELKALGIGVSVHFIPLHIHPYYKERYGYKPEDFPVAYETYQRIISLPIYPKMSDADVERVISAVASIANKFKR